MAADDICSHDIYLIKTGITQSPHVKGNGMDEYNYAHLKLQDMITPPCPTSTVYYLNHHWSGM